VKVAANFALLLRNKFNAIKHRLTRLNFEPFMPLESSTKPHQGQTQGSGEK
jgi:hypothetical protein